MSSFLAIKKVFDLSASSNAQMLVSRQSRELSASSNDVVTTMKKHFDYTVDVSFDSAGGTACTSSTYVLGQTYQELPTTERSSYIFQGWYTQLTGGTQISAESIVELSTTTLYAQWKYVDVGDDYTEYIAQTTSSYKKTGIYSATRYSSSSPVVVDWGDGNVEAIEGNISQLAHEYSSVGTFHVKVSNTSDFQPSQSDTTWYDTTSQNKYTFKDVVKTGSHCSSFNQYAFYCCAALSSINFLSSCFTSLTSIPNYSFYNCKGIKQLSSLPSRIKTLGAYSFEYCTGLTGIQDLRNTGLTSFYSTYIFAYCTGVKEFKLPSNIGAYIGNSLFYYDNGLTAIEFPSSLTSIAQYAMYSCTGLKSITIPSNIKNIGSQAFRGCSNLSSVTYETSALTSIGTYAFYQNYALRDLTVPDTVKSIGSYAFYYCYNTYASSLTLPSALTSLGTYAYQYCYSLKELEIPGGLTSIANYAFTGCRAISSITDYRLTAQTIYSSTFGNTANTGTAAYTGYSTRGSNKLRIYSNATGYNTSYWLSTLQDANKCGFNVEYIDQQANDKLCVIVETTDYLKKSGIYLAERDDTSKPVVIDWGDGTIEQINGDVSQKVHEYASVGTFNIIVKNIKSYAATNLNWEYHVDVKQSLREVTSFPESISCIPAYSFTECNNINRIAIPSNILLIDNYAFSENYLSSLELNNGILSIGNDAFGGSDQLKDVQIPDSVTYIGNYVFTISQSLSSISIGAGVQYFGDSVFKYCNNLESIYVSPSNQHFKSDGGLMLTKDGTGFVACIQTSADIVIPSTVRRFPDQSFAYNPNLTSIVMPSSVDYMGISLFSECTALVNAVLPTNITSIPESTFNYCISLTSISIPSTVEFIDVYAFQYCINLSSINIPYSVETIADDAFIMCSGLSSISCPATDIYYGAFAFCCSLEEATFTALDAGSVQSLITYNGIFEGINYTLGPDGQPAEPYDKTVHITCSDSAFNAVFYADGSIEFIEE